MELRHVDPSVLDLSLGRLRQLPKAAVRAKEASLRAKGQLSPLVAAEHVARGRKPSKARKRARKKKVVEIYDLLLAGEDPPGFLARLAAESDPRQARILAGQILEIDYALKVEGERLFSLNFYDWITWMTVKTWTVPSSTKAAAAGREATNLYDPGMDSFYDVADLRGLIEAGADVSALDPPPDSSTWRDPGDISAVDVRRAFYMGGDPMHEGIESHFPTDEAELDDIMALSKNPGSLEDVFLELTEGGEACKPFSSSFTPN